MLQHWFDKTLNKNISDLCRFSDPFSPTMQTLNEAITAVGQFKCKLEEEFKNNQVQVSQS